MTCDMLVVVGSIPVVRLFFSHSKVMGSNPTGCIFFFNFFFFDDVCCVGIQVFMWVLTSSLQKVDTRASAVEPVEVPLNVTQVSLGYIHKQIAVSIIKRKSKRERRKSKQERDNLIRQDMDNKIKNYLNCVPPPPPKNYECPPELLPFFEIHYPKQVCPILDSRSIIILVSFVSLFYHPFIILSIYF